MNILTILHRNIKWRFHNTFTIIITILQPILWLVLYSAVAGQTMESTGIENYTAFIFPGLVVLVSFSACSSGGIMNYLMKSDGSFYRILIAPIRRSAIVLGQLLETILCTFLEISIMGVVSLLFSVRIAAGIGEFGIILLLIFLTAFFMSGLAYGISLILPNEVVYETVMNAIVLPVFFLSTALFPANEIDGVLGTIINLNPFTHVINALRSLILYGYIECAAIATAISQMVSTLVYLTYVLRKKSVFSFSIKEFSPTRQMITEILKIGVPTLVFQLLTSLSIALINRASSNYGDSVIAGMGAVTRVTSMGTLVVFGFLKGFQPIAGFSYGAKKFDRLREAIKTSIIWSTSFCLVVGLVMAVFSMQIISQFTEGDNQMILVGQKSLFANGITFILFGFYTVYSSLFLALGKGAAGFFLGACRQGVCFVPVILLLPMVWGMNGILYAQPIADVISVVITVFMALHLHRELSMAEKQAMSNSEI